MSDRMCVKEMKQKRIEDGKKHIYFYLKDDDYGWMSNFYPSVLNIDGMTYPTVEHYYQSMKTFDGAIHVWISNAPKPFLAMTIGRKLRGKDGFDKDEWEKIKVNVMLNGLRHKFHQLDMKELLLKTGNAVLHEDSPSDKFWGVKGKDQLGKCLMQIREEILDEIRED